jgi:TonB family protein
MLAPDPSPPAPRRSRAWAALAASALAHAAVLAWLAVRAPSAAGPEPAIDVVFLSLRQAAAPEPAPSPRTLAAERRRRAWLDRLVQPAETPAEMPRPGGGSAAGEGQDAPLPDAALDDLPVEAGGNTTRPVLLTRVQPDYTRAAQVARLEGDVVLKAVIDERGRVTHLEVLRGLALGLDQSALDAVRHWRFRPSTRNGKPVKVFYILTVHFRL